MRQLRESQKIELQALETRNQTAVAAEKEKQEVLTKELYAIKNKYDVAVKELERNSSTMPPVQRNIYVFVDSESWMNQGSLRVLSMQNGNVSLRPFTFKDVSQVWVQMNGGFRVLEVSGEYLSSDSGCTMPRGSPTPSPWSVTPTQENKGEYRIQSKTCGRDLVSFKGTGVSLGNFGNQASSWFMIPVGKM
jgi:hypothetical protein